ncbi:MAG: response regulator transcription factor [Saprospiraceae bacterium]|nr:response regulator transcription factor [Saprospiraceae bacterium]
MLDIDLGAFKTRFGCNEEMLSLSPKSEILILTILMNMEKVLTRYKKEPLGTFSNQDSVDKIVEAIRDLKNGGRLLSPTIARK